MKKAQNVLAVLAMICLIVAVLLTSFEIGIYGDSEYKAYRSDYEKYNVDEALGMEMDDIMEVTTYMMDYLIGREDELSIETYVDGEEQDFFNDQDRFHMGEVRDLFLGGLVLRWVLLGLAAVLILIMVIAKMDIKHTIPKAYDRTLIGFGAALVVIGAACAIDFDGVFTIFHKIFFDNDLWLFDYNTDYMIRMLPEGFFLDIAIRIALVFVGLLLVLWIIAFIWRRQMKKKTC